MSWTNDLLVGVAQLLADAGVGVWLAEGAYPPGTATIIKVSDVGGDSPGLITLTPYAVSDDPTMSDSVQGLQVRSRGDRRSFTADDLDDAVFDVLQGAGPLILSTGIRVEVVQRRGGTPLPLDEQGRHQRSSNYYLSCYRPSPHRT